MWGSTIVILVYHRSPWSIRQMKLVSGHQSIPGGVVRLREDGMSLILIVDDDESVRNELAGYIEGGEHEVLMAGASGREKFRP